MRKQYCLLLDMRTSIYALFCCCLLLQFSSCNSPVETEVDEVTLVKRDLAKINESGKLKALVTYSNTSYFLYRGHAMGFEYELLQRFADDLGLDLEIIISNNIDSLFYDLNKGHADIVAHGLTITSDREEQVNFTDYLYLTSQVLVQRMPDNWRTMNWSNLQRALIHDAIELIGDTVSIRQNSSYFQRIKNLSDEIGGEIVVDTLDGSLSTAEIIQMVVDGDIKYTIADKNIASINASYHDNLNIDVPISFSQRIAWALRPNSPDLLNAANEWIAKMREHSDYYTIYGKYFKNKRRFRRQVQSDYFSLNKEAISPYDELIKTYAADIGWDWRLLAALIYQESRFDPNSESWSGARGLMQLMPKTAVAVAVSNPSNPEASIKGGTKYLKRLWDILEEVQDSTERIKFTMAAYNCGYAHLLDAQELARKLGLDPMLWDENVAEAIRKLSSPKYYNQKEIKYGYVRGDEPYNYVNDIFYRYKIYQDFIEE